MTNTQNLRGTLHRTIRVEIDGRDYTAVWTHPLDPADEDYKRGLDKVLRDLWRLIYEREGL